MDQCIILEMFCLLMERCTLSDVGYRESRIRSALPLPRGFRSLGPQLHNGMPTSHVVHTPRPQHREGSPLRNPISTLDQSAHGRSPRSNVPCVAVNRPSQEVLEDGRAAVCQYYCTSDRLCMRTLTSSSEGRNIPNLSLAIRCRGSAKGPRFGYGVIQSHLDFLYNPDVEGN